MPIKANISRANYTLIDPEDKQSQKGHYPEWTVYAYPV